MVGSGYRCYLIKITGWQTESESKIKGEVGPADRTSKKAAIGYYSTSVALAIAHAFREGKVTKCINWLA